jgi:hypothetical protein
MTPERPREWFDNDRFWRELSGFIFSAARFAGAQHEVEQLLALGRKPI